MQTRLTSLLSTGTRRKALMALITASAGVATFAPGDAAYGTTFTFSTGGGDWLDPTSWQPNGIPGSGDVAMIRAGTTVDSTLTAGTMTIGAIIDNANGVARTLSNPNLTTGSQITLTGTASGQPLIQLSPASATSFSIPGYNGSSTGSFNLVLGASGNLQSAINGTLSLGANISETGGARSITKTGFGTLVLSGSNSFTGSTEVTRGNLVLDFTSNAASKLSSTGSLILDGSSFFLLGNGTQNVSQTVNGLYITQGQNTIGVNVTNAQNATLSVGALHHTTGSYANINYTTGGSIPVVTTSTPNNAYGLIGGWLTVGNNDWAVNDGNGNILPMQNGGSGYTVNDAVNTWQANANITNDTSPFTGTQANDLTIGSLRYNDNSAASTATMASGKTLTIGSGGILVAGSVAASNTLTGGNVTSGADELFVTIGSNKSLRLASVVADRAGGAALALTKSGSGTLTLPSLNTYTGDTYINTGVVTPTTIANTGSASAFGVSGAIHLGNPNGSGAATLTYAGATASTDHNWVFGSGGAVFNVTSNTATLTLGGTISGEGSLTVTNAIVSQVPATLALTGTNSFAGWTLVNSGAIAVDNLAPIGQNSSLGTGLNGGTMTLGSGNAATLTLVGIAPSYSTDRLLQLGSSNGGGSINLVETNPTTTLTWSGTMQFASGQPTGVNGTSITFSTGPNNVRPFQLNAAGTIIFNGNIGNGTLSYGQLQKTGAGTVILGGSNSYQIGTVVNAGTLITNTNFSNGTITSVGTTPVIGLAINNSSVARVAVKSNNNDPAGVTAIPSLSIASTAQLDLTNNALVIYNTTSAASQIRGYLKAGYNNGSWNGVGGIASSSATATSTSGHKTALAYAQASDLFTTFPATYNGRTIPEGADTIVLYTLQGDANLDGKVNALDFNALASNYGAPSPGWVQGDFNYNDVVDTVDFTALANNFNQTTPPGTAPALGTLVPEPMSMGMVAMLACATGRRRRR